jgi:CubicO group peptidase (beta-lactamase class C family)
MMHRITNWASWRLHWAAIAIVAAICNRAMPTLAKPESIWPTQEWRTSSLKRREWIQGSLPSWLMGDNPYGAFSLGARGPHRVNSVTKAVIDTLTAIAWKDGVLDSLNHRVLDFFDPRSIANVDQKKEAITVQNLLDMTSGPEWTEQVGGLTPPIETDRQMAARVDWVRFILDRPMSSAPGDTFNYDSGNPHLLSAILTKLTGMSTLDYAKAKLFCPLGIKDKDVLWLPDQQGISNRGWGLYLQPRDMAKIGFLYLQNGVWEGKQLLPPESVNKVSHPTVETHLKGFRYSNFFWVLPDKHVYMAVGRYGQVIMIFPDLDVVAVTTGHKGYPSSEFADAVSGSVKSDTTIPADAAGETLLANKILDVSTDKAHYSSADCERKETARAIMPINAFRFGHMPNSVEKKTPNNLEN